MQPTFYEFFAGGGMARAGLGPHWNCLFANDFDATKAEAYRQNWGADHLLCADVATVRPSSLPSTADLAWASFPCQDLSLAGDYKGLGKSTNSVVTRSGTFWPFWSLMTELANCDRAPRLVVLENVFGVLTSNSGRDFAAIAKSLAGTDYSFGAVVINAQMFVPQSRPRVFFIAVRDEIDIPNYLQTKEPRSAWHPQALIKAHARLSKEAKRKWIWWNLPQPAARNSIFADLVEETPSSVNWHTAAETERLLSMMSAVNAAKVERAKAAGHKLVGAVYKRTRFDENGKKIQRAEVRFDDIAGCLRTPRGGSSRQTILIVEGPNVRSRLLSTREAARLMGLDDSYRLPSRYNDAYQLAGDGVCVPVVRHLASHLLEPLIQPKDVSSSVAA
jgi:DNA (cytosine-5)-methyltransferase 1